MTFSDEIRCYDVGARPQTEDAYLMTPFFSPDAPAGTTPLAIENGFLRIVVSRNASHGVRLYVNTNIGTLAYAVWEPFVGTSADCYPYGVNMYNPHFLGIVRLTPETACVRMRAVSNTGDFLEFEVSIKRGSPTFEIRPISQRRTGNVPFRFHIPAGAGTVGVFGNGRVYSFVAEDVYTHEHGAPLDPGSTVVLTNMNRVTAIALEDATDDFLPQSGAQTLAAFHAGGRMFITCLPWNASPLTSDSANNKSPLFRQAEAELTRTTMSGPWEYSAYGDSNGGAHVSNGSGPGNGQYIQYPLTGSVPGVYQIAFRDTGNSGGGAAKWTVTVDGNQVFTRATTPTGFTWSATRPVTITSSSVVRFTTGDAVTHGLDCFCLIPLWRTELTTSTTLFPLDALNAAMRRTTVKRDIVHLEEM